MKTFTWRAPALALLFVANAPQLEFVSPRISRSLPNVA